MSDTTPHSTNDACEQLLDYVYGELDETRKRAFEEHLAGCARCQVEAASFGRVRAAVKKVMPAVEPSGSVNGALHAQLMHAAAQRKPRRGVLLSFPRKIVEHPAWAMAAMFTIVGGAIALNWSHGKMAMPTAAESDQAKPAAAAAPAPPAAEPALADEKTAGKPKAKAEAAADAPKPTEDAKNAALRADYKVGGKGGETRLVKDEESRGGDSVQLDADKAGPMVVNRPAAHRAPAPVKVAEKEAAPKSKKVSPAFGAKMDDAVFADGTAERNDIGRTVGGASGAAAGANTRAAPAAAAPAGSASSGVASTGRISAGEGGGAAKSSSPDTLAHAAAKPEAPKPAASRDARYGAAAQPPAKQGWQLSNAPAQAPPPPAATVPASPAPVASSTATPRDLQLQQSQGYYRNKTAPVQSVAGPTRETEALRKKADDAARSNRCDEAIKLYQELDKLSQYITPTERLNYVRCLNQQGRQDEALKRLDELKTDKRITNSELQKVETEITDSRRRQEPRAEKKAPAKKPTAAPADRAAQQQQRAADQAPAETAPPQATDTKVQKSY